MRLQAVDVALTEVAIGSGLTGVLLLGAAAQLRAHRTRRTAGATGPAPAPGRGAAVRDRRGGARRLGAGTSPSPRRRSRRSRWREIGATGLGNPVTAVLMAYRAIDTLLEKVVLVLALVGVWSLAPDRGWGGRPGTLHRRRPDGVLPFFARMLPPIGVVVGVYLMWIGADEPGGAFQGGTILAAMWLLVMMAGLADAPAVERTLAARRGCSPGRWCSSRSGSPACVIAGAFLAYPADYAKPLILAIEVADDALDRAMLALLVAGAPERRRSDERRRRCSACAARALVGLGLYGADRAPRAAAQDHRRSTCSAAASSCCSAWSRGAARRPGSAATRCRRRW